MRQQYAKNQLDESDCPSSPFGFFQAWLAEAIAHHAFEANACVLSTVNGQRPSSRVVLLKEMSEQGFVFFSNYKSRKAIELESNRLASMLFFWADLERQVRVEGNVERIAIAESDAYFLSRPQESRLSALISPQSSIIPSKKWLADRREAFLQSGQKALRPANWGGYVLKPDYFEFWQGGKHRLHDRIAYKELASGEWEKFRLAP